MQFIEKSGKIQIGSSQTLAILLSKNSREGLHANNHYALDHHDAVTDIYYYLLSSCPM